MQDLENYFRKIWRTNEGFKADCPKCGKEKKFFWNSTKQCGICFHDGCPWHKGVYLRRALAHFTLEGLYVPEMPEVVKSDPETEIALPGEYRRIVDLSENLRSTLYSYMASRGIPKRVVDMANVGYCEKGRWWGYIIFPVFNDDSKVVYWQARRFKDREPKFYNPSASYKSELVYRVNPSVQPKRIILVESIFNALTLETFHTSRTVVMALLGKSLSDTQMQYILQFERRLEEIVVALDGDARREAVDIAERLWSMRGGFAVFVAPIPNGEDINSLGREEAFRRIDRAEAFNKNHRMELMARSVE